jgi:hypothetical protein
MTIATTLMINKSKRNTIATGDLDLQPLKLQRGSGNAKKGDKQNNNSKQKKEMFISQEKTNATSRCNKVRAEARAQGHNDDSSSLYSEGDERRAI